ncbi:MAG: EamA family transporter [Acidimicrobiia bacterium]|nr:EamA family transporter [Acidimicrobiia bacterium]NNF09757.1 EamA family transporter [Acidimicrobiia bacterium]
MFDRLWPPLVLAGLAASWGVIPVIVREVGLSSGQLAASRIWLATGLQLLLLAALGGLRFPETSRRSIVVAGLLLPVHWFTFFQAIETTRVLVALVLVFVAAPAMSIAATRVLGEPLALGTGLAVAGGFVGAAIAVDPSNGATAEGVLWALASGGLLAAMILTVKPGAADLGAIRFGAWQGVIASVVTLPWAISAVPDIDGDLGLVLFLGLGLTGVSGIIYLATMHRVPISTLSSMMYMEPIAAVVAAWILLDENPGGRGWIGIVLVVGFGIVVGWSNDRAARLAAEVGARV